MKRKIFCLVLSLVLILTMMPSVAFAVIEVKDEITVNISDGEGNVNISVNSSGIHSVSRGDSSGAFTNAEPGKSVRITSTGTSTVTIKLWEGATAEVILDNANITNQFNPALKTEGDGDVNLYIIYSNTLNGGEHKAGLNKSNSGKLTIRETNKQGDAFSAGIGDESVELKHELTAIGGYAGAGIGGNKNENGDNIIIESGTIIAKGGAEAAGIGGGSGENYNNFGNASNIIVNGGTVTAEGGMEAAGIGGGRYGKAENIIINGGTVTATGGMDGAGIGGGISGDGYNISIEGGEVIAKGTHNGAGIGGGENGSAKNITVKGGKITAESGNNKAFGAEPNTDALVGSHYVITGNLASDRNVKIEPKSGHQLSSTWSSDGELHWKECTVADCTYKSVKAAHIYDDDQDKICNTCEYDRTITPPVHNHTLTPVPQVVATHFKEGKKAYYKCSGCDSCFEDSEGRTEIEDIDNWGIIPVTNHQLSDWKHDESNTRHWKECMISECNHKEQEANCAGGTATCTEKAICSTCDKKYGELAAHSTTHHAAVAATCIAKGNVEYWSCSVCHKNFDSDSCTHEIANVETDKNSDNHRETTSTLKCGSSQHWREWDCCGSDVAGTRELHTYDNDTDTTCNGCDYTRKLTITSITAASSNINNKVPVVGAISFSDENIPTVTINPLINGVEVNEGSCYWVQKTSAGETIYTGTPYAAGNNYYYRITFYADSDIVNMTVNSSIIVTLNGTAYRSEPVWNGSTGTGYYFCIDVGPYTATVPEHTHSYLDSWQTNGTHHWKICTFDGCNHKGQEAEHTGGKATTKEKAICSTCEEKYGELATGGSSSGSYIPITTKPEVKVDGDGGNTSLSSDGKTATITPDEGYVVKDVTVNGVSKGAVTEIVGLKAGDKVVVTFEKKSEPTPEQRKAKLDAILEDMKLKTTTSYTSKKNIKVNASVSQEDIAAITDMGYEVEFRFSRATKKGGIYYKKKTSEDMTYTNTAGKKGTKYYYRVQLCVYEEDILVGKTALKQSSYGVRTWKK